IDYSALSSLISYAYRCCLTVTADNVQIVMMTANYLELKYVMEKCASFICEHLLVVENAIELRTLFLSVGCSSAMQKVDRFIEKNFALVSHNDSFLELSFEDLTELLSKDRLNVVSEKEVFSAAMRWIEYSSDRTDFIGRTLLKMV
ncbi:BTB And Kelch, partial [Ancylostoma duodenale]